jgi:hypothetical protein
MNKFNKGEVVLYQNGDVFELGIVKEVLDIRFEKPTYRVWYHTGDTTAVTSERHLHKVSNAYAFNVIRKSANNKDINLCPARQLASRILGQVELYGDFYYQVEDWLTDFLEGNEHDMPIGIEAEYLRMALRVELRDFFDSKDIEDIEPKDIEECVDRIVDNYHVNVLNTDFINDVVDEYIEETRGDTYLDDKDYDDEGTPCGVFTFKDLFK